jgi:hypothetical protein
MSEEEAAERAERLEREAHAAIAEFSLEDGRASARAGRAPGDVGRAGHVNMAGELLIQIFDIGRFHAIRPALDELDAARALGLESSLAVLREAAVLPFARSHRAAATIANWATYFISLALFFSGLWFVMARPVLALARQLDAYVKAAHQASTREANSVAPPW